MVTASAISREFFGCVACRRLSGSGTAAWRILLRLERHDKQGRQATRARWMIDASGANSVERAR
jgi:hypothetical protein